MSRKTLLLALLLASSLVLALARNSAAQADFDYRADPPRVQVSSGAAPHQIVLPFCPTASGTVICYAPPFLQLAYNFPFDLDGTGQTILVVDAFGSPTIQNDLAVFDSVFGIPDPPSFTIYCPEGCPPYNPHNHHVEAGWAAETTLDVEYAHAMAPGANIVLVVAATSTGNAVHTAEAAAIKRYPGSIMTQSFGVPEILIRGNKGQISQAEKNYLAAQAAGITVLASTGDLGATNGFSIANAQFPASDPLVTAVGGTQGDPYPGGLLGCDPVAQTCTYTYGGEQVWNEPAIGAAGGGAPSFLFGVPSYQSGLTLDGSPLTSRTVPDVSYNAAYDGGVLVYLTFLGPANAGFYLVAGTSAATPQWASIFALVNQCRANHSNGPLGFANSAIYALAQTSAYTTDFHDITVGNNQLVGTPVGFSAVTGWDAGSGWGTPNVTNLVSDLAGTTCP